MPHPSRPAERVVSFLPAATEMLCALGLADRLVGVSHECDYPPEARARPIVVRNALDLEHMTLAEIDTAVAARIGAGESLYEVDETLLRELAPDLILTQDLCQVCAPSGNEVTRVLRTLPETPEILWLTPHTLAEIEENVRRLGDATGATDAAEAMIARGRERIAAVRERVGDVPLRRVFFMEWVDPVYCGGHWVPEMIEIAGGTDRLARRGTDSVRTAWDDVIAWAPEVMIVAPCGFHLAQAADQARRLAAQPGWSDIPAVREGRVYAVDANAYFARPGPRVIDGVELLAHVIHPECTPASGVPPGFLHIT